MSRAARVKASDAVVVSAALMPAVGEPAVLEYAEREGYETAVLIVIGRSSRHTLGADDAVQPVLGASKRLHVALDLRIDAEEDVGWCKRGAEISADQVDVPVANRESAVTVGLGDSDCAVGSHVPPPLEANASSELLEPVMR